VREFDVIRAFSARFPAPPEAVIEPAGDDCAVVRLGGETWVAAADMLVSGRHFEDWAPPEDVGYKAVAANVSDVAAMGGIPRFVLVSGGAPDPEVVLRCMEGVLEACREFEVYPLGGDTTGADALVVDVAILGNLETEPILRSGARPGHLLAVTGELGASAAGLIALQAGGRKPARLVARHLRPRPRVAVGRAAARLGAGAMIDLSDGLASDVRHLCDRSGVGCRIDLDRLPVADDTRAYLLSRVREPRLVAATGGEDYELLLAAPEDVIGTIREETEVPLTVVGEVTPGSQPEFALGGRVVANLAGWDHF
jgi:thiamine-monophosphate kinase